MHSIWIAQEVAFIMKYCRAFSQGCIQSKIPCFTVVKFVCVRTVQCTHFICIYVECTPKDAHIQYMAAFTLSFEDVKIL